MLRTVSQLSSAEPIRVLVNGEAPGEVGLRHPALINYGHFTAMQVRDRQVRGLALHFERIVRSHRALFATELDVAVVRSCLQAALQEMPDCYLRVVFFEVEPGQASVMTVQRPPVAPGIHPVSLMPVDYQRAVADVKHMGSFSKIYHSVLAERAASMTPFTPRPTGSSRRRPVRTSASSTASASSGRRARHCPASRGRCSTSHSSATASSRCASRST